VIDLVNKKEHTCLIIGVDKTDIKQHKIAFISLVARVLSGLWKNELAERRLGEELKKIVVSINY
jgi:transcription elongation GreA/GreB family factor